jgi:DNA repair exonuclease SbcCD nuclease subunit
MKIAFMGDTHLHPLIWESQSRIRGDAYEGFRQVVEHTLKHANLLVLAGDIFDRVNPDSESVKYFLDLIQKLRDANIPVMAVQGQHDRSTPPWPCLHDWVQHIHGKVVELEDMEVTGKVRIIGFDQSSSDDLKASLKGIGKRKKESHPEIIVLHQIAQDAIDIETDKGKAWDFEKEWLPSGTKFVMLGDNHEPISFENDNGTKCEYSGATHMRKIDEPREHSLPILDTTTWTVERFPLLSRPVIDLRVMTEEHLEDALEKIRAAGLSEELAVSIRTPLVYAQCYDQVMDGMMRLREAAGRREFPIKERVLASGTMVIDGEPIEIENVTLEGCLRKLVDPETHSDQYSFILQLLQDEDTRRVLDALRITLGIEEAA